MSTRRLMEELRRQTRGEAALPQVRSPHVVRREERPLRSRSGPAEGASERRADPGGIRPAPAQPIRDPALLERLKDCTPAKVGISRSGLRYRTQTLLQFLTDFSVAKAAVESQVPERWAEEHKMLPLQTAAADAEQFLARPDLGRRLGEESMALVRSRCAQSPDVQIVVGDGLSATAVIQNAPPMVDVLQQELGRRGRTVGTLVFVRHCRAKILDIVGEAVGARVGVILIGERPGLGTGDGMSAYLVWAPHSQRTDAEKQAISNIHRRGMAPEEAGRHAARLVEAIISQQSSGVGLDLGGVESPPSGADRGRINQAHPEPLAGCGQSHGQQCQQAQNGLPGQVCHRSDGRPCEACSH